MPKHESALASTEPSIELEDDPHVGCQFGQFLIEELLGYGGMGAVYRGTQLSVDRPVAVKLIAGDVEGKHEYLERFRREAQAMAKLRHPNTVRLLDFGVSERGRMFMVMELLRGDDLEQRLVGGPLRLTEALRIVRQVAQSLSEAHTLGIVHRDLKPGNIFLSQVEGGDCFVKVMDFGVAGLPTDGTQSALTMKGAVLGTAAYMSPEQAQGIPVDTRADLYSLGVTLFEMLAGRLPFQASSAVSLLVAQMHDTPPQLIEVRPDAPELAIVQPLLDKLLAKSPDERPANAAEVIGIVDDLLVQLGASPSTTSGVDLGPPRQPRRPRSRSRLIAAALLLVAVSVTLVLASERPREVAEARSQVAAHFARLWGRGSSLAGGAAAQATTWIDGYRQSAPPVSVTIASVPSGATVQLAGAELGTTPYRLQLKQPVEIRLVLAGHATQAVAVEPTGEPNIVVKLEKASPRRAKPPRPTL